MEIINSLGSVWSWVLVNQSLGQVNSEVQSLLCTFFVTFLAWNSHSWGDTNPVCVCPLPLSNGRGLNLNDL